MALLKSRSFTKFNGMEPINHFLLFFIFIFLFTARILDHVCWLWLEVRDRFFSLKWVLWFCYHALLFFCMSSALPVMYGKLSLLSSCLLVYSPVSTSHHIFPPMSHTSLTSLLFIPSLNHPHSTTTFFFFLLIQTNQQPLLPSETEETAVS